MITRCITLNISKIRSLILGRSSSQRYLIGKKAIRMPEGHNIAAFLCSELHYLQREIHRDRLFSYKV
jgi:hypothetical protein